MDPNDDLILSSMAMMPPNWDNPRRRRMHNHVFTRQNLWLSDMTPSDVVFIDPAVAEEVDEMFDPPQLDVVAGQGSINTKEFESVVNKFNMVRSPSLLFVKLATAFFILVLLVNLRKLFQQIRHNR